MVETLAVPLIVVHYVEVARVDLKAPYCHGVIDADVPCFLDGQRRD